MGGAHDLRSLPIALPGRVNLISSSVVGFPFRSLEALQVLTGSLPSIPSSLAKVPIHLDLEHFESDDTNSTSPRELYLTSSVWPLDSSLAPPGCASPSLSTIYPGHNTSESDRIITMYIYNIIIKSNLYAGLLVHLDLPCSGVGTVFMQLCLSIGTEPFHLLNGTYQTFTIFFPRSCQGMSINADIIDERSGCEGGGGGGGTRLKIVY